MPLVNLLVMVAFPTVGDAVSAGVGLAGGAGEDGSRLRLDVLGFAGLACECHWGLLSAVYYITGCH